MASEQNPQDQNAIENINSHLTTAGERLANNKKIVMWVLAAIVIIGGFLGAYFYFFRTPRMEKSWAAYNNVLLQQMKGEVSDSASIAGYKKVADQFGGSDAGVVASIAAAEGLYDQGKYDEAIKYLDGIKVGEPVMAAMVKMLLGDCYTDKGEKFYGKALEAYQDAVKKADSNPQIVPVALIKQANVYDAQKNYAKAMECYEQIKAGYPEFNYGNGMGIDAYIAREKARIGK